MTKKLVWRLSDKPTSGDLREMVDAEILSKEEAHEILVRDSEQPDEDQMTALKKEIEVLRELVLNLSRRDVGGSVTIIREHDKVWPRQPWYEPYYTFTCDVGRGNQSAFSTTNLTTNN